MDGEQVPFFFRQIDAHIDEGAAGDDACTHYGLGKADKPGMTGQLPRSGKASRNLVELAYLASVQLGQPHERVW